MKPSINSIVYRRCDFYFTSVFSTITLCFHNHTSCDWTRRAVSFCLNWRVVSNYKYMSELRRTCNHRFETECFLGNFYTGTKNKNVKILRHLFKVWIFSKIIELSVRIILYCFACVPLSFTNTNVFTLQSFCDSERSRVTDSYLRIFQWIGRGIPNSHHIQKKFSTTHSFILWHCGWAMPRYKRTWVLGKQNKIEYQIPLTSGINLIRWTYFFRI